MDGRGIGDAVASGLIALAVIGVIVGTVAGVVGMWLWQHVSVAWPFAWK